jgi:hypothetical protein
MVLGGRLRKLFKWVRYQSNMGKLTDKEIEKVVDAFVDVAGEADLFGPYTEVQGGLYLPPPRQRA